MKAIHRIAALVTSASWVLAALASEAQTSATASSSRGYHPGTAAATAHYQGNQGFARTDARSGLTSLARGVAVGVDERGLSLSVSQAIAPKAGPALATSFNLSLGLDGSVAHSAGLSVASGPIYRSATAGGQTQAGRSGSTAAAIATGRTDPLGTVRATTHADSFRPRLLPVRRYVDTRPQPVLRGRLLLPARP